MRTSRTTGVCLAIVLAVTAAALTVSFPTAGASTAACGSACASPSVQLLGTGEVLTVSGSSVKMATASATSTGQDWTPELEAPVSAGISATVVPAALGMNYAGDNLYEFQYVPGGVPSNECLSANYSSFNEDYTVGLYQCGVSAGTLWIVDQANAAGGYVDLISAGFQFDVSESETTPFAEPGVLTASSSGQVTVTALSELGGVVNSSQNWSAGFESAAAVARARAKANAARS